MLTPRDNLVLATTKLRTRRVRLGVTLVVSGLLFSVLIVASLTIHGLTGSILSFTKEGFLDRFIVSVQNNPFSQLETTEKDPKTIARANAILADTITRKTAEAKRLGIDYDPKSETSPIIDNPQNKDETGKIVRVLDMSQPAAQQAVAESIDPAAFDDSVQAKAKDYHATHVYQSYTYNYAYGADNYELAPIIKGKEQTINSNNNGPPDPIQSFSQSVSTNEANMMKPFMLSGTSLEANPGDPVPILAPMDAAEKILSLPALPNSASSAKKITHLGEVRSKAAGYIFDVCYRNEAAAQLMSSAQEQASNIAAHKHDAGFVTPSIIYAIPTDACQPVTIAADSRTASQKAVDDKQASFDQMFGTPAPVTQRIHFRIVGLLPKTASFDSALSIEMLVNSFITPSFNTGWIMSHEAASANPILKSIIANPLTSALNTKTRYVEFTSRADEKRFIDKQSCQPQSSQDCGKITDTYVSAYGNPLSTLYEAGDATKTFFSWVLGIIALLSALIMMGTVGKVIADSRKETSVFRALGARRSVISQIYLLYAAILGLLTFATALIIGVVIAGLIDASTTGNLSATAVLTFNAHDLHKQFHLIGWSATDIAAICGLVVATSLFSAIVPLLGNIRRDPVKDMREE